MPRKRVADIARERGVILFSSPFDETAVDTALPLLLEHATTNPATGEKLGTVPAINAAGTQAAVTAAHAAFPAWAGKTAKERTAVLRRWHDLMMANVDDLAVLMTAEQGKPLAESRGEPLPLIAVLG